MICASLGSRLDGAIVFGGIDVDVDVDFDLANENFDDLGLRLDSLLSNSRICYPHQSVISYNNSKGNMVQYHKISHRMLGGRRRSLGIGS